MRDRDAERREYERRQHQLRGCGDPGCAICNPDTANSIGNGINRGADPYTFNPFANLPPDSSYISFDTSTASRMAEAMRMVNSFVGYDEAQPPSLASNPKSTLPPQTYRAAREKVKQWIIPAPTQAFTDIIGNDEALTLLREAIQAPVLHKELYEAYSMKAPRGALLSGPPGCGKTMFAKAAAAEMVQLYGAAVEFISLSGPELQTMYVGETEARIRDIFAFAREYSAHHKHPLLIFIDEAEVILPDRTGRARRVAPWEESQVAQFLTEMDGMRESGAFLLLASNRPEAIDSALLRDGRCDFKIKVARPTREAVETILLNNFTGKFFSGEVGELVTYALEALFDPSRVITDAHAVRLRLKDSSEGLTFDNLKLETKDRHFLLEHIISGAMAASIPARATRHAFSRDVKAGGTEPTGITPEDVLKAVSDLFTENKDLEHAYAMEEFQKAFLAELNTKGEPK
jgi:SpoVK/Ycf46/Vps4 family AAA+-type ATPase